MDAFIDKLDGERLVTRLVEFLPHLVTGLLILLFFWVLFKITQRSFKLLLRRARIHETLIHMLIDNIYRIVLLAFGLIMAADQIGINVATALAGLGVAGIAVGFAAQDSLANVIAGFLIFWDKPFQVDDWVTVAGQYGRVRTITMRTTRIRTNNNTHVVIPNRKIIDEVMVNHSQHGMTRVVVPTGIAYKEYIPKARQVILEAVGDLPHVLQDPAPDVVVTAHGSSSIDMDVRVWISDIGQEQPVYFAVMEATKLALDAAGIEIPYPHLQLFVENVEDRVWSRLGKVSSLSGLAEPAEPAGADG